MIIMNTYIKIENIIFCENDYDKAISLLDDETYKADNRYLELKAVALFKKNLFAESANIYKYLGDNYQAGYCFLLLGDEKEALSLFNSAETSPAQNWGIFFCELFTSNITTTPTYLQIRAFLEKDLNNFLKLDLANYVQKIIDISDFLCEINSDANKYIAKAFLYNDYFDYAKEYIEQAFDTNSKDAEVYYLNALYYKSIGQQDKAKENLQDAIRLNNNYYPAKLLLESF